MLHIVEEVYLKLLINIKGKEEEGDEDKTEVEDVKTPKGVIKDKIIKLKR